MREAVDKANESLSILFGQLPGGVTVEEFWLEEDKKNWYVTLSFPVRKDASILGENSTLNAIATLIPEKKWRTFKIDADTGEAIAMRAGGIES